MEESARSQELLQTDVALKLGLNHRQLALVRHALDRPGTVYSIKLHRNYHNVSYQTARTDLLELSRFELLDKKKVGREFMFFIPDSLRQRLEQHERNE